MRKRITLILALMLMLTAVTPAFAEEPFTIGVVYKQTGNPYFVAALHGFEEAQKELGFQLISNGPADASNEGQIQIIESFIQQGVDAIAIAANDPAGVVNVLQVALDAGIKVISFDSPVNPEARNLDIVPASMENIGRIQAREMAEQIGYEGQIAILSGSTTMENINTWVRYIKDELTKEEYANIELVTVVYGDDLTDKSYQEVQGLIDSYPNLKGVIAPTTVAIAAAATCIADNELAGQIKLTGVGLPSEMADYVLDGVCEGMYLWNPIDLGYCTAYACHALLGGTLDTSVGLTFDAGRLGSMEILYDGNGNPFVSVGEPFRFTAENIAEWKDVF